MECRAIGAVLLVAGLAWAAGAEEARIREIVLGGPYDSEAALNVARVLAARLEAAGIKGTAQADPRCPKVRVRVDGTAGPDPVRALLTRPFGQLEFRRVLGDRMPEADCAAARAAAPGSDQLCLAAPVAYAGETASHYLTEPAFAVPRPGVNLGYDTYTAMPQLVLTLGADEAGALCELTRANVGGQVAIVIDGVALSVPYIVEPICGGTLALSGNQAGETGMRGLEETAARIAATMLPPPAIEREALLGAGAAPGPLCGGEAPAARQ
jgi:preprotein translocase subunit SecD